MLVVSFITSGLLFLTGIQAAPTQLDDIQVFPPEYWQSQWDAWSMHGPSSFQSLLERRAALNTSTDAVALDVGDICARVQGCVGKAAATAAAYAAVAAWSTIKNCGNLANTVNTKMTENNYKLAKQVAAYTITELVIPVVYSAPLGQLFNNAFIQNAAPQGKQDECGIAQIQAIAEQSATVTYGFCMQLASVTKDKAFSRFDFGTVSSDSTNDDVGLDMKMRMFISTVKGKHDVACSLLGVSLKKR